MRSSSINRSGLSRESMNVIETLAGEENTSYEDRYKEEDYTPGEYRREETQNSDNKSREIDMLWQTFKPSRFNTNSPMMCFIGGCVTGVLVTLITMSMFGTFSHPKTVNNAPALSQEEQTQESDISAESVSPDTYNLSVAETSDAQLSDSSSEIPTEIPANMKKYVIKDGDTVEGIIKHFYGKYTPERAEAIMKANNLKNLDRISIDQVLLIPMDK